MAMAGYRRVIPIQFVIPPELDHPGLHDHLKEAGFNLRKWREVGKRWRILCRGWIAHVSIAAGGKLRWMLDMAAQQIQEQSIEISVGTLTGRRILVSALGIKMRSNSVCTSSTREEFYRGAHHRSNAVN